MPTESRVKVTNNSLVISGKRKRYKPQKYGDDDEECMEEQAQSSGITKIHKCPTCNRPFATNARLKSHLSE